MTSRGASNLGINSVRSCAALLVVLGHLRAGFFVDFNKLDDPGWLTQGFYALTGLGHQAVLVFFVLSGFWVGGGVLRSAAEGRFMMVSYGVARLTRLWIVLIPALLLTVFVDQVGLAMFGGSDVYSGANEYHSVFPRDIADVSGVPVFLGNLLFVQDVYVSTFGTNTPLWSLAYEFWYYAIFPPLALTFFLRGRARWAALGTTVLLGLVAGEDVLLLFPVWLSGVVLAAARPEQWRLGGGLRKALSIGAVFLLLASMVGASLVPMQAVGAIAVTICTLVLIGLLAVDEPLGRGVVVRFLDWFAERSFTLYAVHNPLAALTTAVVAPVAVDRFTPSGESLALFAASLLAICGAAIVLAQFTEIRTASFRRWVTDELDRRLITRVPPN